jgi:hypothetical protein
MAFGRRSFLTYRFKGLKQTPGTLEGHELEPVRPWYSDYLGECLKREVEN